MMRDDRTHGAVESGDRDVAANVEHDRLIEMLGSRGAKLKEPALDRRQRDNAGHVARLRRYDRAPSNGLGQFGNSLVPEDVFRPERQAPIVRACDDLDAKNRVAAKFEEVVVHADVVDAQHLRPDARERDLDRRVHVGGLDGGVHHFWQRQRIAIELAVHIDRERRQLHD